MNSSDAYVTFTVTAERLIAGLYVDGIYQTLNLTSSNNWWLTDKILIDRSATLIAIRANPAVTTAACSGILGSVGDYFVTDATWKCSTEGAGGWYTLGFNDSAWPNAVDYGLNSEPFLCPHRYELPEISSGAHWIYTADQTLPANCRGYLRKFQFV